MQLNQYMTKTFPSLGLRPALFYNWKIGIRFELGVYKPFAYKKKQYLQEVYQRAITLFKSLHAQNDDLYIVVDVNNYAGNATFNRKLKTFSPYMKEKSVLYRLHETTIPYMFPEDDEEETWKTHRFTLQCKTSDLRYAPMLKAICNQDMGIRPRIFHRVYFINIHRNTIFHVYDDRGCDVLATSPETIRHIYNKYNDWILDYDRAAIDRVFHI